MPRRLPTRLLLAVTAAATMSAAPRGARAQQAEAPATAAPAPPVAPPATVSAAPSGFGATGTWVFTFETADSGYGSAFFHKTSGDGGTTVQIDPGADYFLAPNVSLGANLLFSYSTGSGGSTTDVGGGVRAGYNLPLVENVGFWPTARVFVLHYGGSKPGTTTSLGVLAPFIWHATTHFFLGGGPDLNRDLSGGGNTEYGLDFILGGWL